ncbi:hypothetical protein PR202_gb29741 [Eleusine coracana subsp. coracana]|uniref:F-box domain-containing protein n=1 Tax=Eleusine coracana subsp. coracana TaxID=191504 RepID=A0AAV5G017_ELECO|nr:hypothetical protein PR202_gb29741 [Eleusine coracana subsp. coracana]
MEVSGRRSRVRVSGHDDDRISNLSDDLLHNILLKLRSTTAAARTSVLSRRWRHLWAALPDLLLENVNAADSVDAALAACSAPTAHPPRDHHHAPALPQRPDHHTRQPLAALRRGTPPRAASSRCACPEPSTPTERSRCRCSRR